MPPPSLILLDIQLPDVDGITILETIRATPDWQNVPVIKLTAVSDEQQYPQGAVPHRSGLCAEAVQSKKPCSELR